jgi:hypothetical protein
METVTPGSKITLIAMYDHTGKVAGCYSDKNQSWACHFCDWIDCPMKGKYLEAV